MRPLLQARLVNDVFGDPVLFLDFLDEHGVNTTEFRAKAASMSFDFSTKTFHGGQQVFGSHNRISQTNIPKTPRGGAGG